ncbi:MAG: CDP-glycerol glycerophosphotransferase family protein [Lachnospiraceae bacterium]|nr:CDP-glycerol glycerophosphotransferase family protein [Lachnospiraceae bacterium]
MKKYLKKILLFIYRYMAHAFPVIPQKAMFMSNMGRNYSGNVRAIYEKMKDDPRFARIKKVWAFNGDFFANVKKYGKGMLPKGCRIVRYGGIRYYFHMATSGLWVFDTRQEPYLIKRKGNIYFQTWHGTPLKKLGLDIDRMKMAGEDRSVSDYRISFLEESAKWDYLLVQNDFSEEVLPKCFGYRNEVIKAGYPRNDRLAEAPAGNTGKRKKVLLYAPTWRDNEYLGGGFYKCPSRPDFNKLEKELGRDYVIIVKLHYLVKLKKGDIPEECIKSGFIRVCGNERDISELYLKADGLITDYSSVFFDYSVLERPIFFFCYDLEEYRDELRGFYLDFEKVAPGPISTDEDELVSNIRQIFGGENTEWKNKVIEFKKWFNEYDDGHASERVLDVLASRCAL